MEDFTKRWQSEVQRLLQRHETAETMKNVAMEGRRKEWTSAMTGITVQAFREMGLCASAKGHRMDRLPIRRSEYLSLDVIAMPGGGLSWCFPVAVAELENSARDDLVAYALWKVLCVRAEMRAVFCYRDVGNKALALVQYLRNEVIATIPVGMRLSLEGDLVLIVGTRGEADTFPYGFFKWWRLERNTLMFHLL